MSRLTNVQWRKLFIYQVYVRSHTPEGTFQAFNKDINRIHDLGVDVVYFMPIHPIGKEKRKGSLGCPYSIQDYRSINPEYGTMKDFEETIETIHAHGMKVMIDVVYNHTSHDSVLLKQQPEYFLHDEQGNLTSKEPGWSDVQDFDYSSDKALWTELIDTLLFWMDKGVDGFRFDVASFLPYEFLKQMQQTLKAKNPNVILLSESVHGHYCRYMRNKGYDVLSESEIFETFDMAYDYDVHVYFEAYLKGEISLKRYVEELLRQEMIYPKNYIKMRNLENHDFGRFAPMVDNNPDKIDNWTAFIFFLKGSTMIYAGQEFSATHKPSLFEKEVTDFSKRDISALISKMATLVKNDEYCYGVFDMLSQEQDVLVVSYEYQGFKTIGIFNIGLEHGEIHVSIPDGQYKNLIDESSINIISSKLELTNKPVIIKVKQ